MSSTTELNLTTLLLDSLSLLNRLRDLNLAVLGEKLSALKLGLQTRSLKEKLDASMLADLLGGDADLLGELLTQLELLLDRDALANEALLKNLGQLEPLTEQLLDRDLLLNLRGALLELLPDKK